MIEKAADLLRKGELVAFPTETVYGLGANALDEAAVRKIYAAKGRPETSPLIVHVKDVAMARELAAEWPKQADELAKRFWPGPLTIVVPKSEKIPDIVTAGLKTVGLRMPNHPIALALLRVANIPLAAPSANKFTQLSPTTAQHVRDGLGDAVSMILDGGPCKVGIESTVVSMTTLLRPGAITKAQLEEVLGPLKTGWTGTGAHPAPGLHGKHYSPKTKLILGTPPKEGKGIYLDKSKMPANPEAYAATLYETLHQLDTQGWDWIAIEPPPTTPEWEAVNDRLSRASAK